MTTPAPPQAQPQQGLASPALATAVAAAVLTAVSAAAAIAVLRVRFALSAAAWRALGGALGVAMEHPPGRTGITGPASAAVSSQNAARRAQFVLAAASRIVAAEQQAVSRGQDPQEAWSRALATERKYLGQHLDAMWNRAVAAGKTDMAAREHGDLLGWYTVRDSRTSAECKAADGWNYRASAMPAIGYPGGVHPHCRCYPGAPHPRARVLPAGSPVVFVRAA